MDKKMLFIGVVLIALVVFAAFFIGPNNAGNKTANDSISYISCGCGCCVSDKSLEETAQTQCLYKSKGESIQAKIDQDQALTEEYCANVGCSMPTKYVYCD
jgi:poly-D-alanine transfer protein DltD